MISKPVAMFFVFIFYLLSVNCLLLTSPFLVWAWLVNSSGVTYPVQDQSAMCLGIWETLRGGPTDEQVERAAYHHFQAAIAQKLLS